MRILFPYLTLYKKHKWMLFLSLLLTISTLLSNIGLLTLSGWFLSASAVVGCTSIYNFNFMLPAAGIRIATIIRTAGRYFERLVSHDITFHVLQYLRVFFFKKIFPLFPSGLISFRYGELLDCIIADVNTLDQLYLRVVSPLFSVIITIAVVMIGLSFFNMELSIILSGIFLLIFFFFPPFLYFIGKPIGENLTQLRGEYRQKLTQWLHTQAELSIFNASSYFRSKIENIEVSWEKFQFRQFKLFSFSQVLIKLIGWIVMVIVLWLSAGKINRENIYCITLIIPFIFCVLSVFETIIPTVSIFYYLGQIIFSISRINKIVKKRPLIFFKNQEIEIFPHVSLQFKKVSFSYRNQVHRALEDISFDVPEGAHVAVLGRTGCGKSTLLQLLTRAWDPQDGSLFINNIPLSNLSEVTLRRNISVVPQRVYLFSATLRDNLILASPKSNDNTLLYILEKVGLHNLLEDDGLNQWIGEGGRQLSGGELKRIAIARAILHDAPLVLLDEPTDGLDIKTETQIFDLFSEILKNKTVLMVTHRLYRLSDFDQIIIIDNGKIIEKGTHAELLANNNQYYYFNQYRKFI